MVASIGLRTFVLRAARLSTSVAGIARTSAFVPVRHASGTQTIRVEVPEDLQRLPPPPPRLPRPQEKAPDFRGQAVVNRSFKEISLQDFKDKWLYFFFYPLDFTFVCPTEIIAFSDRAKEFKDIGCEVVACSTDSHFTHLAWINTSRKEGGLGEMKIPVLADYNKVTSRNYGVLLDGLGAALRGSFLIDPKGVIRHVGVNDLPVGRSVDEALRLVQAFQYVDKHGEVCPVNWEPEKPTINPADAKKYFSENN